MLASRAKSTAMSLIMSPQKRYIEVITLSADEYDLIWK